MPLYAAIRFSKVRKKLYVILVRGTVEEVINGILDVQADELVNAGNVQFFAHFDSSIVPR